MEWKVRFFMLLLFVAGFWIGRGTANGGKIVYIGTDTAKYESAMLGVLLENPK